MILRSMTPPIVLEGGLKSMHRKIKEIIIRSVDAAAIVLVAALVMFFLLLQGVVLSSVVNAWRLDTYIPPIVGIEAVFLLFSLVWAPLWCLLRYHKGR